MATEAQPTTNTPPAPPAPDAKVETPKVDAKVDAPKVDAKVEPKTDAKVERALALGEEPKVDEKKDAKVDTKAEVKPGEKPAALDLKLPEGFTKEDPAIAAFLATAGKHGLKAEQAQEIFDGYVSFAQSRDKALAEAYRAEGAEWLKAAKEAKDLGAGSDAAWAEVMKNTRRGLVAFGDQELMQFLDSTNGSNHPAMVRLFNKLGKALGEDNALDLSKGGKPPAGESDPQEALYQRYPTMRPKAQGAK
jgi:hypothetical protein